MIGVDETNARNEWGTTTTATTLLFLLLLLTVHAPDGHRARGRLPRCVFPYLAPTPMARCALPGCSVPTVGDASLADAPPHPPRALGRPVMAGKAASRPCANGAELARAPAPAPHLLAATTAATTATAATTTASPPPPPPPPPPSSPSSPLLLPTTRTPRAHGGAVGRSLKLHV
ncbi:hypothetical protein KM043_002751 [Ampulex compressa]|nr:hypothetical protein KM043_002751 [Ampulex compressa]